MDIDWTYQLIKFFSQTLVLFFESPQLFDSLFFPGCHILLIISHSTLKLICFGHCFIYLHFEVVRGIFHLLEGLLIVFMIKFIIIGIIIRVLDIIPVINIRNEGVRGIEGFNFDSPIPRDHTPPLSLVCIGGVGS